MQKRILIIDDERDICSAVKAGLEMMGDFEVDFAMNGRNGIKAAKKFKPDLIILNIRMVEMDGIEVLKMLKKDMSTISIPVIMLTTLKDDTTKIECCSEYDEAYLEKPVDLRVLKAKIEEVLKRFDGTAANHNK